MSFFRSQRLERRRKVKVAAVPCGIPGAVFTPFGMYNIAMRTGGLATPPVARNAARGHHCFQPRQTQGYTCAPKQRSSR